MQRLLLFSIVVSLACHFASAISAEQQAAVARDALEIDPVGYGIMMDAGSTGSRIHVYRYEDSLSATQLLTHEDNISYF